MRHDGLGFSVQGGFKHHLIGDIAGMGRVRNGMSIPSDTAASALMTAATFSRLWPVAFRVLSTASYSRNSAVEQSGVKEMQQQVARPIAAAERCHDHIGVQHQPHGK